MMKDSIAYPGLLDKSERYSLAPFVDSRGLRRSVILHDLSSAGLDPQVDLYGNIWVRKQGKCSAKDDKIVVVSSHMDTAFGFLPEEYVFGLEDSKDGPKIEGTIDNSMGCAINAEIASLIDPYYTTYFLFTVGEEPPNRFNGAKGVLEIFEDKKIEPDLFIALDVTYPEEEVSHYPTHFGAVPTKMFTSDDGVIYHVPDEGDQTSAYAENFSNKPLEELIEKFVEGRSSKDIETRREETHDEASFYGCEFNAFAFGPVAYGILHSEDCTTYLENLEHCAEFLAELLTTDSLKSLKRQHWAKEYVGRSEAYSLDVSIADAVLDELNTELTLGIPYTFRIKIEELIDTEQSDHPGFLFRSLKDFISATKKRKKEPIVHDSLELPISSFILHAISEDINFSGGYVHVDDSGFVSFIPGLYQIEETEELIDVLERQEYIKKRRINFAPFGEKPVKRTLYVPTQKGMRRVSLDIRAISPDVLYEDIHPEYISVFEQYREAVEIIMNPLMNLVSSSDVDEKEELLDILLDAHNRFYSAEMVINHERKQEQGISYAGDAREGLNNFLRLLSKKAGKQSSVYLNCVQLIEELEVM